MSYNAEVRSLDNLEEVLNGLIGVYEDPPEGIDIDDYDEGDIEEGTLEADPTEVKLFFHLPEDEIPKEIEIHKTFTPWYADEDFQQKTHGYGCDVGVNITVSFIKSEFHETGVIGTYRVTNIEETG
jgi:hypothetical protein